MQCLGRTLACLALAATVACAQIKDPQPRDAAEPAEDIVADSGQTADPWEGFNRAMFSVNEVLDSDLLFPLADAYVTLVPQLVRTGVSNVFRNAADLWSAVNQLLQGKLENSTVMTMRFVTNTVFGVAGILDIATEMGMERTPEDFGQTLGVWGMPPGNYLVLPFFGPSTVRDAIGLPLDVAATPAYAINQGSFRPVTTVLQIIDTRAGLLGVTKALDQIALDKYSFVRDAFLARRLNLVFDGNPPDELEIDPPPKPPTPPTPK
jgi:phospholipid-binding lipoprotein MlaA